MDAGVPSDRDVKERIAEFWRGRIVAQACTDVDAIFGHVEVEG
jgi:hypothetical protein